MEIPVIPYSSRIPVDPEYLQALGQVVYNFASVLWNFVYLGSLNDPTFVQTSANIDFVEVAKRFESLVEAGDDELMKGLAARFTAATVIRDSLLRCTPITSTEGTQILYGRTNNNPTQWTELGLWKFAQELESLDIDANALYYKLKDQVRGVAGVMVSGS
jgi:hypothetical protein